jgi:Carboxypeptidase regulatory-like domain
MKRLRTPLGAIATTLLLAACAGAASTPPPASSTPAPTTIASVEDAAARVIELNPGLSGIGPEDPTMIGSCCSWTGSETGDGYTVTFEVGWGDCPAGCIDSHQWTFAVSPTGAVTLLSEEGSSPIPSGVPGHGVGGEGGGTGGGGGILPGGTGIQGHVMAGPTCPVVKVGDPNCADRPLAGVTIVALTSAGMEAARTTTDASGLYALTLPPGPYTLEPQPVEGFIRGAPPIPVVVDGVVTIDIPYDTGIR